MTSHGAVNGKGACRGRRARCRRRSATSARSPIRTAMWSSSASIRASTRRPTTSGAADSPVTMTIDADNSAAWAIHLGPAHRQRPDVSVADELLGHATLVHACLATWTASSHRPALSTDGDAWMSYGELADLTERAARRLSSLGVTPGA